MKLKIRKTKFIFNSEQLDYNDLFDIEFFKKSDIWVEKFEKKSFYCNELFLNYAQRYYALYLYLKYNDIDCVEVKNNDELALYAKDVADNIGLRYNGSVKAIKVKLYIRSFFYIFLSFWYFIWLMIKLPKNKMNIDFGCPFSVIRSKSGKSKISKFSIPFVEEYPFPKDCIYTFFSKRIRIRWVFKSLFKTYSTLSQMQLYYKSLIGNNSSIWIWSFYQKRIISVLIYEQVMDAFFSKQSGDTYYTANNLDHYSVIEEKIAAKYGLKTICIPHGLEYGFKMPKGFSCDLFYTNSENAAKYLNKIYNTKKYVFDEKIALQIFKVKKNYPKHEPKLIFFTEPRESYVNLQIINALIPLLSTRNIPLYIKHHPGDDLSEYSEYNLPIINDLDESICGNICISRKSTTLLEAAYNGSKSAAILLNPKDLSIFSTFPSLQSERITVKYSIDDLFKWICDQF